MNLEKELDFAIRTAKSAGNILLKGYREVKEIEWNRRHHFKTETDDLIDEIIKKEIAREFPEHNVYSEEGKGIDNGSEFSWVYDSLDGTIPFTFEINDHFSVSISLVHQGVPVVGVTNAPKRREFYHAVQGIGAFCNGKRITTSHEEDLNRVMMGLDFGKQEEDVDRRSIAGYYEKMLSPDGICVPLSHGAAAVPLCLVAAGKLHAYLALSLEPWDMTSGVTLVREAGGRVTNINGEEWKLGDKSILAANPVLHQRIYDHLEKD